MKLKVAFFGTSDRSVPILESLDQNFDLVLCVTKSDSKFGRKHELKETGVKKWAKQNNINFIEIPAMSNNCIHGVTEALAKANVDLGVVADFSFILPESIINTPKWRLINIHFSLLPKYRGASPVQAAILNGEKTTGITYYVMDRGMDTGSILSQYEYNIPPLITAGEMYDQMFELAAQKLPIVINDYVNGHSTPHPQNHELATYTFSKSHPKNTFIYKEDAEIDWSQSAENIERQIRAFIPWPVAWTTLGRLEKNSKITDLISLRGDKEKSLKTKIFNANSQNGKLQILTLQVEGSKQMDWNSFKNGYAVN